MQKKRKKPPIKVIIAPGNGGTWPKDNWFPYVKRRLEAAGIPVVVRRFPDPVLARQRFWLPFLAKLGADRRTVLIGHSSGAVAAMRYAESHQLLGSILVGACHTDLGVESERASGYYGRPWRWDAIRRNQKFIIQFASTDDPFIPIREARFIHRKLATEYYEATDQGHFSSSDGKKEFPEIVAHVLRIAAGERA